MYCRKGTKRSSSRIGRCIMLKYKGMSVDEVLEMGNAALVDGMINSVSSKKSRNRGDVDVVKECVEVLDRLNEWKEKNGLKSEGGKRGKYEGVEIESLNDGDLSGMYESLYSRRCYYGKVGNKKKVQEIEELIAEIKRVRTARKIEKLKESIA